MYKKTNFFENVLKGFEIEILMSSLVWKNTFKFDSLTLNELINVIVERFYYIAALTLSLIGYELLQLTFFQQEFV